MSHEYAQLIEEIKELDEKFFTWSAEELEIPVATSLTDDTVKPLKLVDTLQKKRISKQKKTQVHWLPSMYCENTKVFRHRHLMPLFNKATIAQGF